MIVTAVRKIIRVFLYLTEINVIIYLGTYLKFSYSSKFREFKSVCFFLHWKKYTVAFQVPNEIATKAESVSSIAKPSHPEQNSIHK